MALRPQGELNWLVAALTLCACGGTAPLPRPVLQQHPPASQNDASRLDWDGESFEVPLLPAISADGAKIVIAKSEPARGAPYVTGSHPSLELIEKTRDDKIVVRFLVLSADEADAMFDAAGMKPELRARVAAATNWLGEIDHRYHLVALEPLDVVRALDMPSHLRTHAVGIGITVDWEASQLEIVQREQPGDPGRSVVHAMTPASWLVPDHPTTCTTSRPNLDMVYGDAARHVIVLEIGYAGADPDTCIRPPNQIHVVAW